MSHHLELCHLHCKGGGCSFLDKVLCIKLKVQIQTQLNTHASTCWTLSGTGLGAILWSCILWLTLGRLQQDSLPGVFYC